MEFRQYLLFVRRWLWLIALLGLGLAAASYLVSAQSRPMYESKLTILVNAGRLSDRQDQNFQDLVTSERRAVTYSLLLTKRSVMEGVVEKLGLATDPGALAGRITVEFLRNTELIDLTVRDTDPERAALIANELVRVFNEQESSLLDNPYAAILSSLHAVEPARTGSLVPSDAPRNGILALVVGLMLAVAFGIIWEHFDDRIRSSEQLEQAIGLTPLVSIGRIGGLTPQSRVVTLTRPTTAVAEAFRMLRAHLDIAAVEQPIRSLVVVSAATGDGKSTTAANIAVAVAQTSARVILIDGNLRQPSLHTLLKLNNGRGLSDLLAQSSEVDAVEYLVPTELENLRVLTHGSPVVNPARHLGGQRFSEVLAQLHSQADLIVIDSPQLLGLVDASMLVQAVDAAVLVVRAGQTRVATLKSAYAHLTRMQTPLLGIVLNRAARPYGEVRLPSGPGGGGRRQHAVSAVQIPQAPKLSLPGAAISAHEYSEQRKVVE